MNMIDFSKIPSKEKILEHADVKAWNPRLGRPLVSLIIDVVVGDIRKRGSSDGVPDALEIIHRVCSECRIWHRRRIVRVVNATGILLHTNMGRSPILNETWETVKDVNTGYSNLEFNLETGKRGKRNGLVPKLLNILTGGEASMVVNNNAAAVFLVLSALGKGRDVIVSRGEQVQIGGGFRIPEILSLSGARLVEIGTTNITTLEDYKRAIHDDTACVLSVHRSNFAIRGFTSQPPLSEIKKILPENAFLFVDQGSGTLTEELKGEPRVASLIREGADLVTFSCDKVLGGPQGGVVTGKEFLIKKLEKHQLYRVFRPGKTVFSLLEDTLIRKLNGASFLQNHLFPDLEVLRHRAEAIIEALPSGVATLTATDCSSGGGSSPDETFPSFGITLTPEISPDKLLSSLRDLEIPVIGYISDNHVCIDLAAVSPEDDGLLRKSLLFCIGKDS